MSKGRHHFVPRFYLTRFQSEPKRIHVYNLKRFTTFLNASLRDQCYKHKLYGSTDDNEDRLQVLEGLIAPHLRTVVSDGVLPSWNSEGYSAVLAFVAVQLLRTPGFASRINEVVDKMVKQAYSGHPSLEGEDLDRLRIGFQDPVSAALKLLPEVLKALWPLKAHLVVSRYDVFVTSDQPVYRYNQYCERIRGVGITGLSQRGIQMFVPLSPRHYLVLYDGVIYDARLTDRRRRVSRPTNSDIDSLNMMQLLSADKNIYFSNSEQSDHVGHLRSSVEHLRLVDAARVVETESDSDPNSSLIHAYERTPNLSLRLQFLYVNKLAGKVPIQDRLNPTGGGPSSMDARVETFSRIVGQR